MASYPATLPPPRVEGYELSHVDQAVRTDFEVGAARVRRRTAARNDRVALNWLFTDIEMSSFRAWFDDAVNGADGGAAWFTVDLPLGAGVATQTVRFVGPYQAALLPGLRWKVTASVEVR